jgi:hypothetical protein
MGKLAAAREVIAARAWILHRLLRQARMIVGQAGSLKGRGYSRDAPPVAPSAA